MRLSNRQVWLLKLGGILVVRNWSPESARMRKSHRTASSPVEDDIYTERGANSLGQVLSRGLLSHLCLERKGKEDVPLSM